MNASEFQALKQAIIDDVRVMMQTTGQVTQYIGARYVPLIADPIEWSDQKEYEPLTIVTYQGNSYTSRQFVPKGTPITNEQFWASTGNFNAQIEQYRQEVAKFDSRITSAQAAADSKAPISHATDSTEYGVGNKANYGHVKLSDDLTSSDSNAGVAATPKMVKDAAIPRILLIGDSWSVSGTWVEHFKKIFKCTLHGFAAGGNGYVRDTGHSFGKQVDTAIADSSFKNSDIDMVIVYGSINDGNDSGIYAAANAVFNKLDANFPQARKYIIGEQNVAPFPKIEHANGSMQIKCAALEHGYSFTDAGMWGYQLQNLYTSDNAHMTEQGYKLIASNIASLLSGNKQPIYHWLSNGVAPSVYAKAVNAAQALTSIDDMGNITVQLAFGYNTTDTNEITLATLNVPFNYGIPPVVITSANNIKQLTADTAATGYVWVDAQNVSGNNYKCTIKAKPFKKLSTGTYTRVSLTFINGYISSNS